MENERLPIIPWPKSFVYVQVSSMIGLACIIYILKSSNVLAARIAFGSFLIAFAVLVISIWKFKKDMAAQNAGKEIK